MYVCMYICISIKEKCKIPPVRAGINILIR